MKKIIGLIVLIGAVAATIYCTSCSKAPKAHDAGCDAGIYDAGAKTDSSIDASAKDAGTKAAAKKPAASKKISHKK